MSNTTEYFASRMNNEVNKALLEDAFGDINPSDRLIRYKLVFNKVATKEINRRSAKQEAEQNDEIAVELLNLIESELIRQAEAPEDVPNHGRENAKKKVGKEEMLRYVIEIYPSLPTYVRGPTFDRRYRTDPETFTPVFVLPKTKTHIISEISSMWNPRSRMKEGIDVFDFLVSMCNRKRDLSWETYNNNKHSFMCEEKIILESLEHRCKMITYYGDDESPDPFYFWMKKAGLSDALKRILAEGRASNGGIDLAMRDGLYAEVLDTLRVEQRSEEGLKLAKLTLDSVAMLDEAREELHDMLQPKNPTGKWRENGAGSLSKRHREIGNSEIVVGEIIFDMINTEKLTVRVMVPEECSKELAGDVFGRAKRHILNWKEGYTHDVDLTVLLLGSDFEKSEEFK